MLLSEFETRISLLADLFAQCGLYVLGLGYGVRNSVLRKSILGIRGLDLVFFGFNISLGGFGVIFAIVFLIIILPIRMIFLPVISLVIEVNRGLFE